MLPDRLSKMSIGRGATEDSDSARSRRMQRARTMGDLLKSIITGIVRGDRRHDDAGRAELRHRPHHRQRRDRRRGPGLRRAEPGQGLLRRHLHDLRGPARRRRLRRPRRGQRHRRGGQPARHPAPRRQRDRLVRPQRRDPARRQPEPELGADGARRVVPLPRGRRAGASRPAGRRRRPLARRGLRPRDHRAAGDLGHRGRHGRRDHHARDPQDRAAGAVAGGPRDAGPDQGEVRRRGHLRAVRPARSWSTRARTTRPPPRGPPPEADLPFGRMAR